MAGLVKRADVKEDKDGKSRGMGTVTFEQPLEAVQAICILSHFNMEAKPLTSSVSCKRNAAEEAETYLKQSDES